MDTLLEGIIIKFFMMFIIYKTSAILEQELREFKTYPFSLEKWGWAKLNNPVYSVYTCTVVCTPLFLSQPNHNLKLIQLY